MVEAEIAVNFECRNCGKVFDEPYKAKNRFCDECGMRLYPLVEPSPNATESIIDDQGKGAPFTASDVWTYFKTLNAVTTLHRPKKFQINRILGDAIVGIPEDSDKERSIRYGEFLDVWKRWYETGSNKIGQYQDISRNASYIIAVIEQYRRSIDEQDDNSVVDR